jgi:hypothetical protein
VGWLAILAIAVLLRGPMQCCVSEDMIAQWDVEDGAPLTAFFTGGVDGGLSVQNGHGIEGSKAIHSSHSGASGQEGSVLFPSTYTLCNNGRREFTVGGFWAFHDSNYNYLAEIRDSSKGVEVLYSIYRVNSQHLVIYNTNSAEELFTLLNVFVADGRFYKIEVRGAISSYDQATAASAPDGWLEVRVNDRVYHTGDNFAAIDPLSPPADCDNRVTGISVGLGGSEFGWDKVTFKPQGDLDCPYIKEVAAFCEDTPDPPSVGGASPDCPPPGPGGSTFDGTADGPRLGLRPGAYRVTAADYDPPTGGGISATESDPTDPQSLTGIPTPLITLDVTLADGTVRRASQAGPLPASGRAPATWTVLRFGPVEYARSDRFGSTRAQVWDVDIADPDGSVRADLEHATNRFYRRWTGQLFGESNAARLAGTARRSLARGRCVAANTTIPQVITLTFSDELHYPNSAVSLDRQLPHVLIGDTFKSTSTATGVIFTEDAPEDVRGLGLRQIYGPASDEWRLLQNEVPAGIVPLIYVGDVRLLSGSETWQCYFVSHYACKAVKSLFGSNLDPQCPGSVRLDPDLFSTAFLVPDLGNWASYFSTPYFDVTCDGETRRVTLIFGRGERSQAHVDGEVPLSANVWGKEDVGDGSGDLIMDGAQIVQALFHWPILQRAMLGNEAMPTFTGGTSKFRTSSAVACDAIHAARVSGGYPGALIVDDLQPASEWLARALVSYDLREHRNHHGQSVLTTLNESQSLASLTHYDAVHHVRGDSFRTAADRAAQLENARPFDFGPEPATGRLAGPLDTRTVDTSVANWDADENPYTGDDLHLIGVYDRTVASDVVGRALRETQDGILPGEVAMDLDVLTKQPGDLFTLTDFRGLGATGWTQRLLLVDAIVLNPNVSDPPAEDDLGVLVRWQDMQQGLVAPAGLVGGGVTSDGLTTSWVGFHPVGNVSGGDAWTVGNASTRTAWRVG